jgi:hypothetical protein
MTVHLQGREYFHALTLAADCSLILQESLPIDPVNYTSGSALTKHGGQIPLSARGLYRTYMRNCPPPASLEANVSIFWIKNAEETILYKPQ